MAASLGAWTLLLLLFALGSTIQFNCFDCHKFTSDECDGIASTEVEEGTCTTYALTHDEENCFSFKVSEIEFKPKNEAYYTTKSLCSRFGNPNVIFDYSQCVTEQRRIMFNYTDSNDTWVFSLQVDFSRLDAADTWQISFINFTNATKTGVHSYSFNQSLQSSNDFYAYLGQTYSCNMVSFMDDQGTTGISFDTVNVQAFGSSNPSDVRNCHNTETSAIVVGIVIGVVVGSFVVLAAVTLVIVLVYRRLRYGNYNLLDS